MEALSVLKQRSIATTRRLVLCCTVACAGFSLGSASFAQSVGKPVLPGQLDGYFDYAVTNLPAHFSTEIGRDNTPATNQITDAGATLGRVLFYDKRLSHNNSMSCASCHLQENGFSTPDQFSAGVNGTPTPRHTMALANSKFYENGRFLWDERAPTLEDQVLLPIENVDELGTTLVALNTKLATTSFYGDLFANAFGTSDVTSERVSQALAQFLRSMVSYNSKYDSIFDATGQANIALLTAEEQHGLQLFNGQGRCASCHESNSQMTDQTHNNGLDAFTVDPGAGDAEFKVASLRNAEVRGAFMHDGRFSSLAEVVEFYSTNIHDHPNLDFRLRENFDINGAPVQFNFTPVEIDALIAFLKTLTDNSFLNDPKFSDPFVLTCDFSGDESCDVGDLNQLLAEGPIINGVAVNDSNAQFDLNADGTLDNLDVQSWLADAGESNGLPGPYLAGDANLDGIVDVSDFNRWNSGKFTSSTDWDAGDFNGDGVVDVSDFGAWNGNKFTTSGDVQTIPEPTSLWPAVLCGLLAISRWQRKPPIAS